MRFFAFAALAPWLALPHITLGSHPDRCPCIAKHSSEWAVSKLESTGSCHEQFGIGCNTHNISASCAVHIYESDAAAQLECNQFSESPWCKTKWCYVNPQNCSVDWDWGVLGPYSYAPVGTCDKGLPCFSKSRWPHFCRMIPSGSCTRRAVWYEATWETPNAADTINTRKTGTAKVA